MNFAACNIKEKQSELAFDDAQTLIVLAARKFFYSWNYLIDLFFNFFLCYALLPIKRKISILLELTSRTSRELETDMLKSSCLNWLLAVSIKPLVNNRSNYEKRQVMKRSQLEDHKQDG